MRRLITALAIICCVVIAGMTALVVLVNPNDFRLYMMQQVQQRSGYALRLDDDLRWHIWPQLSILTGRMSVSAPGALQPVITADNMRLDVDLLPLLSHRLSVRQVMLKNAVVRMTTDSEAPSSASAPAGLSTASRAETAGWKFDISRLKIADSLLIWQRDDGEQINFRDINLDLAQDEKRRATVTLSSYLNRDQRELLLALSGNIDFSRYPQYAEAEVSTLNYQLKGADLPVQGITGSAALQANWHRDTGQFDLTRIELSANGSQLSGTISGNMGEHPRLDARMQAARLDLDSFFGLKNDDLSDDPATASSLPLRTPVIADALAQSGPYPVLTALAASLQLQTDALRWRGIDMQKVLLDANNAHGDMTINTLTGQIGRGTFSLPGKIDMRLPQPQLILQPVLHNIRSGPLLRAFALPAPVDGQLSLIGVLQGKGLTVRDILHNWTGNGGITLSDARLPGLNFLQMVQQAVVRNSEHLGADDIPDQDTLLQKISATANLNRGVITLSQLQGTSPYMALDGKGRVDLLNQQCDMKFGIRALQGWKGDPDLVNQLINTPFQVRIYGNWDSLQYALPVDQVLRKQLQNKAKARLNSWSERHQDDSLQH